MHSGSFISNWCFFDLRFFLFKVRELLHRNPHSSKIFGNLFFSDFWTFGPKWPLIGMSENTCKSWKTTNFQTSLKNRDCDEWVLVFWIWTKKPATKKTIHKKTYFWLSDFEGIFNSKMFCWKDCCVKAKFRRNLSYTKSGFSSNMFQQKDSIAFQTMHLNVYKCYKKMDEMKWNKNTHVASEPPSN